MKHNCSFQAESGKCVIHDLVHAVHAVNDVLNPSKPLKIMKSCLKYFYERCQLSTISVFMLTDAYTLLFKEVDPKLATILGQEKVLGEGNISDPVIFLLLRV